MDKRTFLKAGALAGIGAIAGNKAFGTPSFELIAFKKIDRLVNNKGTYVLPDLPYSYDALNPYIDTQTLEIHHGKHHAGYVKGLNNTTKEIQDQLAKGEFKNMKHLHRQLAFHGAGHLLHTLYWNNMGPKETKMSDLLKKYIIKSFGNIEIFKKYFVATSKSVEASGWGILAYDSFSDKLVVLQAEKHQNLSLWASIPILVCDVWEHAYYLKYQNRRGDYIKEFMEIINWEKVSERLDKLVGMNK